MPSLPRSHNIVGRWVPSAGATGFRLVDRVRSNHGTLTNMDSASDWVASGGKGALSFDGTNDQLNLSRAIAFGTNAPYAVTAWINKTALGVNPVNNGGIFRDGNTFLGTSENAGRLWGRHSGTALASASTGPLLLNAGWSHVGITWNGSTASLVFNGAFFTSASAATSTAFSISVIGEQSSQFLLAELDDITIWNTALTANEVRFLYEQGRGGGMLYQPPRRRSVAAVIAALVLACETGNYSLTGQAAGLFASRVLAADQAQYILSGNAANITASRLLSADPASYTATGNEAATICARLLDGVAAAYALTGTDAGLIANRKLTADQAVCFLAGNNADLLRSLKLNAGSMAMQIDNFAASLLADRKISADGAQYLLVVSDANLTGSASGVAPYYYLFMMRGPQ